MNASQTDRAIQDKSLRELADIITPMSAPPAFLDYSITQGDNVPQSRIFAEEGWAMPGFYETIAGKRKDAPDLRRCVEDTVEQLLGQATSTNRPGILLGRIQGGKTRAFIGVIGLAFDRGYDVAVILTKGTVSLARQTLKRVRSDFEAFTSSDRDGVQIHDIMTLPANLTRWELSQKLILVVKKEDDNLKRLISAFRDTYPQLQSRRVLIVDDEADLASVTFRKKNGEVNPGVISAKIEDLRNTLSTPASFLQVTATPYSLYLQPEEEVTRSGSALFRPKRPAFTQILPEHANYVGGEYYFEESSDPAFTASFVYEPVSLDEREALKEEDGRRLRIGEVLTHRNVHVLRQAVVNFVMGAAIRRRMDEAAGSPTKRYSFLFHTEQSRESHRWQVRVATAIYEALVEAARKGEPLVDDLLKVAYEDLLRSVKAGGG